MLNDLCWPAPIAVIVQEYSHIETCLRAYEIVRYMRIHIFVDRHKVTHSYNNPITNEKISCHDSINIISPQLTMYMDDRWDDELRELIDIIVLDYYPLPEIYMRYRYQIVINSLSEMRNMFAASEIHKIWDAADSIGILMPDMFRTACLQMYELLGIMIMKINHEQVDTPLFQAWD